MHPVRRLGVAATVAVLAGSLTACSGDSGNSDSDDAGTDGGGTTITIIEKDGSIDPSGESVDVDKGAEITLDVSSDAEDEIHVHSEPEHEFEVKAADNQQFTFSIDTPGSYEVESHELDVVILKLQVR